jgi:hypothetical protein
MYENAGANLAGPALTELQRRIADRLGLDYLILTSEQRAHERVGRAVASVALLLATLLNAGALAYALVRLRHSG